MSEIRPPTPLLSEPGFSEWRKNCPLFAKLAFAVAIAAQVLFAQNAPEKLAVYVSGASDGGINKSLSGKLLVTMSQSGKYAEIADPVVFQNELASSGRDDIAYIIQAAKRRGADYVCVVSMAEAFGAYSITARLVKISDSRIIKIGTADRALKSLDDLTTVSSELAQQLLPPGSYVPSPHPTAFAAAHTAAAQRQCEKTYNINELLFKVKNGFPAKLKDCSSTLAKDMLNPFGKKLEPKSFMTQCSVDGIKNELPAGFPGTDKIVGSLNNFVQGLLNSASVGGTLDPKKLVSSIGSMDIDGLLSDVKKLADNECVVDEPMGLAYHPKYAAELADSDEEEEEERSWVSFGFRAGFNDSYAYEENEYYYYYNMMPPVRSSSNYHDHKGPGLQLGVVVDFELLDWFHIQPGLMYVLTGIWDHRIAHDLELPLLLSFKLSALRINVGPYFALNLSGSYEDYDIGLSTGIGFDIGKYYIGAFYDYGFVNVGYSDWSYNGNGFDFTGTKNDISIYNRKIGINFGINL